MARKRVMNPHQEAVRARASAKRLTAAKAAAKLLKKAEAYVRHAKKMSAGNPRRLASIESDYEDLMSVAALIRSNNLSDAYVFAGNLDTLVRDQIPLDVWMYIGGRGVHE
jgi:hypothetical protein